MKLFFFLFALVAIILAIYPFVLNDSDPTAKVEGLPWQIDITQPGTSRVFGLQPGISTLADSLDVLGNDVELAIVVSTHGDDAIDQTASLEMYYGHYRAGLIAGKMILQAEVDDRQLKDWQQQAVSVEYMASGLARKYQLDTKNLPAVLALKIQNITFVPAVNLDEELIIARFGEPAETVQINAGLTHYLYPEKGLDIALSAEQKDVLQYVQPADFSRLREPLQATSTPAPPPAPTPALRPVP